MKFQHIPKNSTLQFHVNPQYEGGWKIGGSWTIFILKKPTEQQIKNTEELLGWVWVENNKDER